MSIVLLDTNVVSLLFKGDTRAAAYAPLLQGHRLAVSFMTAASYRADTSREVVDQLTEARQK